jgi:hypothetical protein
VLIQLVVLLIVIGVMLACFSVLGAWLFHKGGAGQSPSLTIPKFKLGKARDNGTVHAPHIPERPMV